MGHVYFGIWRGKTESNVKNQFGLNIEKADPTNFVKFNFLHWILSSHSKYLEKVTPHIILKNKIHHIKIARALCACFLKFALLAAFYNFFVLA